MHLHQLPLPQRLELAGKGAVVTSPAANGPREAAVLKSIKVHNLIIFLDIQVAGIVGAIDGVSHHHTARDGGHWDRVTGS